MEQQVQPVPVPRLPPEGQAAQASLQVRALERVARVTQALPPAQARGQEPRPVPVPGPEGVLKQVPPERQVSAVRQRAGW